MVGIFILSFMGLVSLFYQNRDFFEKSSITIKSKWISFAKWQFYDHRLHSIYTQLSAQAEIFSSTDWGTLLGISVHLMIKKCHCICSAMPIFDAIEAEWYSMELNWLQINMIYFNVQALENIQTDFTDRIECIFIPNWIYRLPIDYGVNHRMSFD